MNSKNKQNNKIVQDVSEGSEMRVLNDNYILGPSLLESTTGDIYAAWDVATDVNTSIDGSSSYHFPSPFFIKFLPENYHRSHQSMQIFIQEIKRLTDCCDWCKVISFGHDGDDDYIVLKLPRGKFLGKKMSTKHIYGELSDILPLISRINTALNILKKCDIQHGRVEPASIFIADNGEVGLLDSIYVSAKQRQLEQDIDYTSTVPNHEATYASPDACFGREISEQDDVFSLACISYHLLSGHHPFGDTNSVSALLNKVRPKRIETLTDDQWQHLEQGMSLKKEDRLKTVEEFINGFDRDARPEKKNIQNTEITTAKQDAQNLIQKQAQSKRKINKNRTAPSLTKTKKQVTESAQTQVQPSFDGIEESNFSTWAWIPLSLLIGIVLGIIAMSLSISLLGQDFFSVMDVLKGLF